MSNLTKVRFSVVLAVLMIAFSAFASPAGASVDTILRDCNDDGALSGKYSPSELKNALENIPSDLKQYSNCESVIRQALLKKVTKNTSPKLKGGNAKGKSASINALTTPKQRRDIRDQVDDDSTLEPGESIVAAGNPAIKTAAGNTLKSSKSPGVPMALLIAGLGLLLLFGIDLAGRLGKMPRVQNLLPKTGRRGDG
ncbi:MAG: hypothetical protein ACPHCI_04065 [Solirubrobacterales bacterium]